MSESFKNLQPKPLKKTEKIDKAVNELAEVGVDAERLAVVMVGNEQLLGETRQVSFDDPTELKNPKRFARFQQTFKNPDGSQAVSINFMIGDLDLVEGGTVYVRPVLGYFLGDLDERSIESFLNLYVEFITRKAENLVKMKAEAAGLAFPKNAGKLTK